MAAQESLDLLKSIDASLKRIARLLEQGGSSASPAAAVASDHELDSQYGDPKVTFNPRDWKGAGFKGRKFSECSADFLDVLAETLDYLAGKAEANDERTASGRSVAEYKRKDAARARGWAKRIRSGQAPGAAIPQRPAPRAGWASADDTDDAAEPEPETDDASPFAGATVDAGAIRWGQR